VNCDKHHFDCKEGTQGTLQPSKELIDILSKLLKEQKVATVIAPTQHLEALLHKFST
jgi:hypothetical protein